MISVVKTIMTVCAHVPRDSLVKGQQSLSENGETKVCDVVYRSRRSKKESSKMQIAHARMLKIAQRIGTRCKKISTKGSKRPQNVKKL